MDIATDTIDDTTVVRLTGNLDTTTSTAAQAALDELMDGGCTALLVNLQKVEFVSSAGLRVLLATAKRMNKSGGSLKISNLNETVNEVFEISGFSSILAVYDTEAAALGDS
jgi:anti-anti-sigma factor